MELINKHINKLKQLCEGFNVAQLYVFGSVLSNNFTPESDIDFLVKFSGVPLVDYFDNYMDLKESLETLFSRKIDLVKIQSLKNPILKRSIYRNKVIVYGRENSKMAI